MTNNIGKYTFGDKANSPHVQFASPKIDCSQIWRMDEFKYWQLHDTKVEGLAQWRLNCTSCVMDFIVSEQKDIKNWTLKIKLNNNE